MEPYFKPSKVAVWARFPGLSIELYELEVDLDTPLLRSILIARFRQDILYEGIGSLCFSCGRVGHRKTHCPYTVKEMVVEMENVDVSDRGGKDVKEEERKKAPILKEKKWEIRGEIMALGC
ncbi:hypothetical protein SO802_018909 [Lithocarpus litseifolius]|uniref:CCHC-type domain-containing protein n=1 Tax=Lithocarpus litseifolius TaxID=425828 RepID=A0AAW2CMP4_9ROSI